MIEVSNDFTVLFSIIKSKCRELYNSEVIANCKRAIIGHNPDVSTITNYDNDLVVIDYRDIEYLDMVQVIDVTYDENRVLDVSDKTFIKDILQSDITVTVVYKSLDEAYDKIIEAISKLSYIDKQHIRLLVY